MVNGAHIPIMTYGGFAYLSSPTALVTFCRLLSLGACNLGAHLICEDCPSAD